MEGASVRTAAVAVITAAAATLWLALRKRAPASRSGSLAVTVRLALYGDQVELLTDAAQTHALISASRALRCIVNYVRNVVPAASRSFVFRKVRCPRCGHAAMASKAKEEVELELSAAQAEWLQAMTDEYKLAGTSKAVRVMLNFVRQRCEAGHEREVFALY